MTSWASLANRTDQQNASVRLQEQSGGQQLVPAGNPSAKGNNSGWGALAGNERAQGGGWGALANPGAPPQVSSVAIVSQQLQNAPLVPTSQISSREVTALSSNYITASAQSNGALSIATHEKQMSQVEELVKTMVLNVQNRAVGLGKLLDKFMEQVFKENEKIARFSEAITRRFEANDPTLTSDEVVKAQAMTNFIAAGVKLQSENNKLAIAAAKEGSSTIRDETFLAMGNILDIRTKQVALFSAKLEVFQKYERHQLTLILEKEKADMELQKEQFNQLEKTVKMIQDAHEGDHKRYLETRKAIIEEAIQLRSQMLKEQEVQNKLELEQGALALEGRRVDNRQIIETRTLEIGKKLEESKIRSNEIIKKFETLKKSETDQQQIASTERTDQRRTDAQRDVANHQSDNQLIASIIPKPPCIVM